jgi:tetratricopeptide (TPR) repeat protein
MIRLPLVAAFLGFLLVVCASGYSQEQSPGEVLSLRGIERFREGEYGEALLAFRDIVLNEGLRNYHGEAYFWIAKSYMALGQLDLAEKNLEFFISDYEDHPSYGQALYQRGRLLFMQRQYENAIHVFEGFLDSYPQSPFKANALFWIGESLYELGHLDEAYRFFTAVVADHPTSFKVEAARYRISLIDLKQREQQLLKLLKWSHEETLRTLEEFQRREKTYEQALAAYQRRLSSVSKSSYEEQIAALEAQIAEKNRQIRVLTDELQSVETTLDEAEELVASLRDGDASASETASPDAFAMMQLLRIKEEALELKQTYMESLRETP